MQTSFKKVMFQTPATVLFTGASLRASAVTYPHFHLATCSQLLDSFSVPNYCRVVLKFFKPHWGVPRLYLTLITINQNNIS